MGALAWLEVLDRRGHVRARHRVDSAPAIIGRGYGSDVLLDDPWLSPVHARLYRELDGSLAIEDAGSENGTWTPLGGRVTTLPLGRGVTLRIGRTLVRIIPADAPVAATLGADASAPSEGGWRQRWVGPVLALGAGGLYAWLQLLDDDQVHRTATLIGDGLALVVCLGLWAGIWALVARAVSHRASYLSHLAIASGAAILLMGIYGAMEYASFLAPGEPEFAGTVALIGLVVLAATLFGHLMLASALPARRAILVSAAVTFGLFALGVAAASDARNDGDSSAPRFDGQLKALSTAVIPTQGDSAFYAGFDELKSSVDSLAADRQ